MHQKTPLRVGKGLPRLALCAVLLAALALSGCGSRQTHEEYLIPKGPAVGFESPEFFTKHLAPRNQDLQSWREMAPTVRKSLRYVKSKPAGAVAIDRPGLRLTWADMERTLLRLQELLPRLDAEPQLFLQNFQWVEVPSGIAYSGYYEPRVKASRTRKPGYEQAIYALPPDMKQYKRRHKGRYYTRRQIEEYCRLSGEDAVFLEKVERQQGISARGHGKILKVARTLADLDGQAEIGRTQLAEAIGFRSFEKKYWGSL